jgi:hypothetical protein
MAKSSNDTRCICFAMGGSSSQYHVIVFDYSTSLLNPTESNIHGRGNRRPAQRPFP